MQAYIIPGFFLFNSYEGHFWGLRNIREMYVPCVKGTNIWMLSGIKTKKSSL